MISSTLRALGCLLLASSASVFANAQNQPPKKTGSISGKVTVKGAAISGITVGAIARRSNMTGSRTRFGAVTDAQGNYRISDLPPGTYELVPAAPQFVLGGANAGKNVILDEGEALEGMDFTLTRGGVISGKVTNSDGQPLIEEQVHLTPLSQDRSDEAVIRLNMNSIQTDDRGMYRVFGLPPGKYTVSAGTPPGRVGFGGRSGIRYKQTFHPSVTDASQATVIDVSEGSEATNVDIVINTRQLTYSASGRVINGATGRPIPNARYGITKIEEDGSSGMSGPTTNALGEFRIDSLVPGKYMITLDGTMSRAYGFADTAGDLFAEALRFDITDHDVTDLVVRTASGASVAGVVVFEGLDQKTARQKFGELMVMVHIEGNDRFASGRSGRPVKIGADGSFTIGGLPPGEAHFMIFSQRGFDVEDGRNIEVARIERDGVLIQQRKLDIKEREKVTGVRVVVDARTGMLQGIVKVENGQLEAGQTYVSVNKAGQQTGYGAWLDARGRFRVGGLAAGTYDVIVYVNRPGMPTRSAQQQVVINDDQVTEVTLTLDLKASPTPDRP